MKIEWHVEKRKVADLIPFEKNPRSITEEGLKTLGESFDEIGMAQPINIDIDNTILSGHARYYKCKEEGIEEVDCYVPNRKLTDREREAVVIRMNKNTAGNWDFDILANEWDLADLKEWGFTDNELCFSPPDLGVGDDEEPETKEKKYILEVQLHNELDLRDLYDDLISKGYMVREK
jgi:ParB-like chromosome segregation protein Spo0J